MAQDKDGDSSQEPSVEHPGRRSFFERFFKAVLGLWGAAFATLAFYYVKAPSGLRAFEEKSMRVGPLSDLNVGEARFVAHALEPFWVVRTDSNQVTALPATCTHLRCVLQWDKPSGRLVCPCHAGAFDLNGNVVSGPPPRPLRPLRVDVKGGIIYVNVS